MSNPSPVRTIQRPRQALAPKPTNLTTTTTIHRPLTRSASTANPKASGILTRSMSRFTIATDENTPPSHMYSMNKLGKNAGHEDGLEKEKMKRKARTSGEQRQAKLARTSQGTLSLSRPVPIKAPTTPLKPSSRANTSTTTPAHNPPGRDRPAPTPAREILQHRFSPASLPSDNDDSMGSPPAGLVARPPTPPKPHVSIVPAATTAQTSVPKPVQTPSKQTLGIPNAATPGRMISPSPRRVLGSISKFRTAPSPGLTSRLAPPQPRFGLSSPGRSEGAAAAAPSAASTSDLVAVQESDRMELDSLPDPEPIADPILSSSTALVSGSSTAGPTSTMPPPSRIPTRTRPATTAPQTTDSRTMKPPPTVSRPKTMGAGLGKGLPSSSSTAARPAEQPKPTEEGSAEKAVKRKPSYPSSLGSGPLARPRDRMVSGPIRPPARSFSIAGPVPPTPGASSSSSNTTSTTAPQPHKSPRSVSAPVPRLSNSTSRREGLSSETSKSLSGLNEALLKLKVRKSEGMGSQPMGRSTAFRQSLHVGSSTTVDSAAPHAKEEGGDVSLSMSTSSRLSAVHRPRPRHSLAQLPSNSAVAGGDDVTMEGEHAGDRSLAALMSSTSGSRCLKGVVAFVDVKTSDGDEAGGVFVEMLKGLGAKVHTRPGETCTHIVFKSGKQSTLAWWRKQEEDERPHIVGIGWVTKSKEKGERQDEERFKVDVAGECVFDKRRKSMEPKALGVGNGRPGSMLLDLSLAQARRRSMLYAPKISSPLKKGYPRNTLAHDE